MDGAKIHELTDAIKNVGFVLKKIEEETYGSFDKPASGERYTGELIIKIRPVEDEEADLEKIGAQKEGEKAKKNPASAPNTVSDLEVPF